MGTQTRFLRLYDLFDDERGQIAFHLTLWQIPSRLSLFDEITGAEFEDLFLLEVHKEMKLASGLRLRRIR